MHPRARLIGFFMGATLLAGCAAPPASVPPTAAPTAANVAPTSVPTAAAKPAATAASSPVSGAATGASPAASPVAAIASSPSPAASPAGSPIAATGVTVAGDATPRVVAAADAFLATLNDAQRAQAVFDFNNAGAKAQWSNLPRGLFTWVGVRMGDLSDAQQETVRALLRVTLSRKGYERVMAGVGADEVLESQSGNNPLQFGAENYFVAVFGTPSTTAPWMFRFGGHHVTINATVAGSNIALTPSFPGCQPCEYTANNQTVRPVGEVTDKAFTLISALDAAQQQQAVLGAQTIDLVLGANQPMRTIPPEGIRASALNAEQQALLLELVGEYVGLLNDEDAAVKMAEVTSNLADTYVAWYGPTASGSAAYFRIQGPTLWIEFSPQGGGPGGAPGPKPGGGTPPQGAAPSGTQVGSATHVHTIYRDPTNEYGAKWAAP
jgi:uncharacterized protein DUF3500